MTANIFINGVIGGDFWNSNESDSGTTLADVRRQINSYPTFDKIAVFINSPGGNVDEGFAIHDLLRSYGKPVTTIGEGQVFSIATVILLAGDKGSRLMAENAKFGIHNPTPAMGVIGDAKAFEDMAARLRAEEDRIINFYNQKTGIATDQIRSWMDETTVFVGNDAITNGFADGIYQTLAAVAYIKNDVMTENEVKQANTILSQIKALLGFKNEGEAVAAETPAPVAEVVEEKENEELTAAKAKIAELEAALAAKETEVQTVNAKLTETENKIQDQENRLLQITNKVKELEALPLGGDQRTPVVPPVQNQANMKDPGADRFAGAVELLKRLNNG